MMKVGAKMWVACSLIGWFSQVFGMVFGQNMTAKDYFLTGTAKFRCRACKMAIADFTKALALKEDYSEAYYGRGLAYHCISKYSLALQDMEMAIRLQPGQVLYREGKARIIQATGNHQESIKEFQNAIQMDMRCWQAWYGIAQSHAKLDSNALSREAYERAILLNPNFAMSYVGLAEVKLEDGDHQEAMENLEKASNLAPDYAQVYELSSLSQLKQGNYQKAIEFATKVVAMNPSNLKARYYRAEAYMATEEYYNADSDYALVVKKDKQNALLWYKRGFCNEKFGDLVAAKRYYGKSLKRDILISEAYSNRAGIWEKFGKPKKALPDLNQALILDPQNVSLRLRRGYVFLSLEQVQNAVDDFVKATQEFPQSGEAFLGLGIARHRNGNIKDACDAWRQASMLREPRADDQLTQFCTE
jgi:tetratricopeptide (TPR) repeat protein